MGRCRWARANADGLGGVDDAAAADRQDEVDLFRAAQRNALMDKGQLGIGLHAAQFDPAEAGRFQRCGHLVKQAGFFDRAAAVVDEDARRAVFLQDRADLRFDVAAKNDLGGCAVNKVVHDTLLRHNVIASIIA